jgi:hypothetical protein
MDSSVYLSDCIAQYYLAALNQMEDILHIKRVIDFYDDCNILSDTPEFWKIHSVKWGILLTKETTKFQDYMDYLENISIKNPTAKLKINEIKKNGPQKPNVYVSHANFYDSLSYYELEKEKHKISLQMDEAIYNYDIKLYTSLNTKYTYITNTMCVKFFSMSLVNQTFTQ